MAWLAELRYHAGATGLGLMAAGFSVGGLAGAVIAGAAGVVVVGAALGLRYALRHRQRWRDGVTVGLSAGGLILAGAALSRHPWRSVGGYAGHSANVQLLALISLAVLAASAVTMRAEHRPEVGAPPARGEKPRD